MTTKSSQLGSIVRKSRSQVNLLLKKRLKKRISSRSKLFRTKVRKVFTSAATTKVKVTKVCTHLKSSSQAMASSRNRPLQNVSQVAPISTLSSKKNSQLKRCPQKSTLTAHKLPTLSGLTPPLMTI